MPIPPELTLLGKLRVIDLAEQAGPDALSAIEVCVGFRYKG
jgi:hypothetical protein